MIRCPACGALNRPDAPECVVCGVPLGGDLATLGRSARARPSAPGPERRGPPTTEAQRARIDAGWGAPPTGGGWDPASSAQERQETRFDLPRLSAPEALPEVPTRVGPGAHGGERPLGRSGATRPGVGPPSESPADRALDSTLGVSGGRGAPDPTPTGLPGGRGGTLGRTGEVRPGDALRQGRARQGRPSTLEAAGAGASVESPGRTQLGRIPAVAPADALPGAPPYPHPPPHPTAAQPSAAWGAAGEEEPPTAPGVRRRHDSGEVRTDGPFDDLDLAGTLLGSFAPRARSEGPGPITDLERPAPGVAVRGEAGAPTGRAGAELGVGSTFQGRAMRTVPPDQQPPPLDSLAPGPMPVEPSFGPLPAPAGARGPARSSGGEPPTVAARPSPAQAPPLAHVPTRPGLPLQAASGWAPEAGEVARGVDRAPGFTTDADAGPSFGHRTAPGLPPPARQVDPSARPAPAGGQTRFGLVAVPVVARPAAPEVAAESALEVATAAAAESAPEVATAPADHATKAADAAAPEPPRESAGGQRTLFGLRAVPPPSAEVASVEVAPHDVPPPEALPQAQPQGQRTLFGQSPALPRAAASVAPVARPEVPARPELAEVRTPLLDERRRLREAARAGARPINHSDAYEMGEAPAPGLADTPPPLGEGPVLEGPASGGPASGDLAGPGLVALARARANINAQERDVARRRLRLATLVLLAVLAGAAIAAALLAQDRNRFRVSLPTDGQQVEHRAGRFEVKARIEVSEPAEVTTPVGTQVITPEAPEVNFSVPDSDLVVGRNELPLKVTAQASGEARLATLVVELHYRLHVGGEQPPLRPGVPVVVRVETVPGARLQVERATVAQIDGSNFEIRFDPGAVLARVDEATTDVVQHPLDLYVEPPGGAPQRYRELVPLALPRTPLTISAPPRLWRARGDSVRVAGTAAPGAVVLVDGRSVPVDGRGRFEAQVALPSPGKHTVTVEADAAQRRPNRVRLEVERPEAEAFASLADQLRTEARPWLDAARAVKGANDLVGPAAPAVDTLVRLQAEVVSIGREAGVDVVVVALCPKGDRCPVWIEVAGPLLVVPGAQVEVVGRLAGRRAYTTIKGDTLEVPRVVEASVLP